MAKVRVENKEGKLRVLTFLIAPNVPPSELKAIENHWAECRRDPNYTLVTNYDLYLKEFVVNPYQNIFISAPNVPPKEVNRLRKKVDGMRNGRAKYPFTALNYDINVRVAIAR